MTVSNSALLLKKQLCKLLMITDIHSAQLGGGQRNKYAYE